MKYIYIFLQLHPFQPALTGVYFKGAKWRFDDPFLAEME